MNDNKTRSMLQRIPVILAVTAASYGLPLQSHADQARSVSSHSVARAPAHAQRQPQATVAKQR